MTNHKPLGEVLEQLVNALNDGVISRLEAQVQGKRITAYVMTPGNIRIDIKTEKAA